MNLSPLICPVCREVLLLEERTYRCENGHSFDLAKESYVNLLLSHQRKSKNPGDDKAMIQARRRFFDSGAFEPLVELVKKGLRPEALDVTPKPQASSLQPIAFPLEKGLRPEALGYRNSTNLSRARGDRLAKGGQRRGHPQASGLQPIASSPSILDCGCGEGHMLGTLSKNVTTPLRSGSVGDVALPLNSESIGRASLSERAETFFGVDVSKEAIRCAAKRYKDATWIVANGMRELPFANESMDVILSVLAPRNIGEFARILKPDGRLVLGIPGPNHLIELRSQLTDHAGDFEEKADEAAAKCAPQFMETNREPLRYSQFINCEQIADLIQMTPIFWNSSPKAKEKIQQLNEINVTISFILLTLNQKKPEGKIKHQGTKDTKLGVL